MNLLCHCKMLYIENFGNEVMSRLLYNILKMPIVKTLLVKEFLLLNLYSSLLKLLILGSKGKIMEQIMI